MAKRQPKSPSVEYSNHNATIPVQDAARLLDQAEGEGFKRVKITHGSSFKDCSTHVIVPMRAPGNVNFRVFQSWLHLIAPMNQKRYFHFVVGDEVGSAYNRAIASILAHPDLSKWKYVLTLEDDNIQPPDAHIRLLESIEAGPFDAVGGMYFTKGDINMPMAYGNPAIYQQTGVLEFTPLDVRRAIEVGNVVPVNGVAMGCTLYRMSLFRDVEPPWFVTVADVVAGKGAEVATQDLSFCGKAVRVGKKFAVDCRVRVGHLDVGSGVIF